MTKHRTSPKRELVRQTLLNGGSARLAREITGMAASYIYAQAELLRRENPDFVLAADKPGASVHPAYDQIIALLTEGKLSQRAIAEATSASVQTVNRIAKAAAKTKAGADPLASAKLKTRIKAALERQEIAPEQSHGFQLPGCEGISTGVNLVDLGPRDCRWPVNAAKRGEAHLFCGGMAIDGAVYCATHHALVYVSREERERQIKRITATAVGAARRNGEKVSGGGKSIKWAGAKLETAVHS